MVGKQKEEELEEEDNRRESAIGSALPLQHNFKPSGVTHQQLSKFRELHRRRLQIKAKSKIHKKPKVVDRTKKFHADECCTTDSHEVNSNTKVEDSSVANPESHGEDDNPSDVHLGPKQRQKLHWGLDVKERWERKANM